MCEDKQLYIKFLNGDKEAFEILISKYKNNIVYFINTYVKNIDTSEDIFEEVILYILENKEKYDFNYSFKTYLYMIAKSKSLNYINRKSVQDVNLEDVSDKIFEDNLLDTVFSNERKIKIQNAIKHLKTDYQEVIYFTQIEELTYYETSQIMNKTEKQIKNLAYNAKKSLKKLLIKEKVIEMKNNKFIKVLSFIIVIGIIGSGIIYAAKLITDNINNARLNADFSTSIGNINENKVWVGTFNLVWNELKQKLGGNVEFENEENALAQELNNMSFTKDMLNENSYYIETGKISKELKERMEKTLQEKFSSESKILNKINWNTIDEEYLMYAMLRKQFTFAYPFVEIEADKFGNSEEYVKYFGLKCYSLKECFEQVEVLFYNSSTDFAVKIKTVEGEEVILYRTNNLENFNDSYTEILEKEKAYTGSKAMINEKDELKVPFIKVNAEINYDEICNKPIKNADGAIIKQAIQNVDFELDNYGGNITSEAAIDIYLSLSMETPRYFNFTDDFILYLKEENAEKPYFALFVTDTDVLVVEE